MAPAATILKLVLMFPLTGIFLGKRTALPSHEVKMRYVDTHRGVPKLHVLRTSNGDEAEAFLAQWAAEKNFGLFVQWWPSTMGPFQERVALIGISKGKQVLLFDMRPFLHLPQQPLPDSVADFLESEDHTFFGMGLLRPVAQLTREFHLTMRVVDLKVRGWPQARMEGGLHRAAEHFLGVHFAGRPSLRQLSSQAVHTYLQWAVAEHCRASYGAPEESWLLTWQELADARPPKFHPVGPTHEHAAEEEELHHEETRAEQLMRSRATRSLEARKAAWKEKRDRIPTARERGGLWTNMRQGRLVTSQ